MQTVTIRGRKYLKTVREVRRDKSRTAIATQRRGVAYATRCVLIEILRRGSIYDTDDPQIIEWACQEQERLAKMVERMNERHDARKR